MCRPCACLHPAYTSGSVVTNGIHNKYSKYSTPIQQQRAMLLLAAAESDESEQHHQVQCGMLSETRASSLKIT